MQKIKIIILLRELNKIRSEMDHDERKAKQMLTNLITNIMKEQGVYFK